MISNIKARFENALLLDKPRETELDQNIFRRMVLILYIMVPVHLVHILIFVQALLTENLTSSAPGYLWRQGIIYAHIATLCISFFRVHNYNPEKMGFRKQPRW